MFRTHFLLPLSVITITSLAIAAWSIPSQNRSDKGNPQPSALMRTAANYAYRDLNKNGKLDVYEDANQPMDARIDNVLRQMTLEEKAGMMFINGARVMRTVLLKTSLQQACLHSLRMD